MPKADKGFGSRYADPCALVKGSIPATAVKIFKKKKGVVEMKGWREH